jgi:hypothetical protein
MQRMGLASQRKKKTLAGLSPSDWLFDLSALQIGFFHSHPSFLRLDSRRIRYRFVMVDDKSPTSESESSQHQSLSLTGMPLRYSKLGRGRKSLSTPSAQPFPARSSTASNTAGIAALGIDGHSDTCSAVARSPNWPE